MSDLNKNFEAMTSKKTISPDAMLRELVDRLKTAKNRPLAYGFLNSLMGAIGAFTLCGFLSAEEQVAWMLEVASIYGKYRSPEELSVKMRDRELKVGQALEWFYDHGRKRRYVHGGSRKAGSRVAFLVIPDMLKRGLVSRTRRAFQLTDSGALVGEAAHEGCEGCHLAFAGQSTKGKP